MAICTSSHSPNSSLKKPRHAPDAQERIKEDADAERAGGLGGRAINGVVVGAQLEQLVPEAELDAQVGQHAPRHERRSWEDRLVIGRIDRRQEDREQADDAEKNAVEQTAVTLLLLVGDRIPQIQAGHPLRRQLGDERDGLPGIDRDPENVGPIALDAFGHKADGRRQRFDAPRIEIWPDQAGADDIVALGRHPSLDRLVRRIAQGKHHPARIGAGRPRLDRHPADDAVRPRRRFDLQTVTAAFVIVAQPRDLDAILIAADDNGLQRKCRCCACSTTRNAKTGSRRAQM